MFVIFVIGMLLATPAQAQDAADFGGQWMLNRELSQFPKEIGFTADWLTTAAVPNRAAKPESWDDAERTQLLTEEVRRPPARLAIADTPAAVTIAADGGPSRIFHPNGREEALDLTSARTAVVTTKREEGRLVIVYSVAQGRQIRYTYSRLASPAQVIVDAELMDRGRGGDKIRRIYDRATATPVSTATAATPEKQPDGASPGAQSTPQAVNQQPDAALKGLTKLGVEVEDLGPQAARCGLQRDAIETMVARRLSDAGFTVIRDSDEDTYIYVNVVTSSSNGLCVSRYDVDVNTNTTAKLSYGTSLVPVQVTLLHRGGIAGGDAAAHGDTVRRGVQEYVDQFSTRIRAANK